MHGGDGSGGVCNIIEQPESTISLMWINEGAGRFVSVSC